MSDAPHGGVTGILLIFWVVGKQLEGQGFEESVEVGRLRVVIFSVEFTFANFEIHVICSNNCKFFTMVGR